MKNLLTAMVLTLLIVPTAFAFTDYGQDAKGRQCASPLKDGTCNIIYTNDFSLIGDEESLDVTSSAKIAQPNALTKKEMLNHQKGVRDTICRILGC
jgi:hypothetical protein